MKKPTRIRSGCNDQRVWTRLLQAAVVAAFVVVAAACGGVSTQSHAALVSRANGICGHLYHELSFGELKNLNGSALDRAVGGAFNAAIHDLRALRPPQADAAAYTRFLNDTARQHTVIVASYSTYSPAMVSAAQTLYVEFATASQVALRLGLDRCATDADTTQASSSAGDYHGALLSECGIFLGSLRTIPKPVSLADVATWVGRVNPLYAQFLRDVRAMRPPASGAASITDWITANAQLKATLSSLAAHASNGDSVGVRADLRAAQSERRAIYDDSTADGIPGCGGSIPV